MYSTNTDLKTYLDISGTGDDTLLTALLARAQKIVDSYCGRTFEASGNTNRTFDARRDVEGRMLYLDRDLCAINSITNGDGTTVSAADYVTEPRNDTPYYAIRLKASSSQSWTYDDDAENAITVSGKWAYSESAPADVVHATLRLAAYLYRQKDNAGDLDRPVAVGNNMTVLPPKLPKDLEQILGPYKRLGVQG